MRRAKPLSEVWIHFERQKIDNKYMAKCKYCQTNFIRETRKKNVFFYLGGFFRKKKRFFSNITTPDGQSRSSFLLPLVKSPNEEMVNSSNLGSCMDGFWVLATKSRW